MPERLNPIAAYDHIAPVFAQVAAQRKAYLDAIDALVISGVPPGSRSLLDVGAGDGLRSCRIAQAAGLSDLTLLEPSVEMRRRWPPGPRALTIPAEDLSSIAGQFDVITCLWNVLGHILPAANRAEALYQFARLVSHRGKIFIDVNHRYNVARYGALPTFARIVHDSIFPSDRNGDVSVTWNVFGIRCSTIGHVFTHQEFCRMIESAGLAIDKQYVVDYVSGELRLRRFEGNLLYVLRRKSDAE
ncbi:MAG: class I SAM-dependent methyltransferase [Bryobacterales bacterium]|nr:class I SAM-dependent methyltransferase [Bryobacterales bacterium]